MLDSKPFVTKAVHDVAWLEKLRGVAVFCQVLGAIVCYLIELDILFGPLLLALTVEVASFLAARRFSSHSGVIAGLLFLDLSVLTYLLHNYGGFTNPLSMLYLLHVILAAFFLGITGTWFMVLAAVACYTSLFFWYTPIAILSDHQHAGGQFSLHLQGMLLVFILMSVLVALFLTRLVESNRTLNQELFVQKARQEKLSALAALAAGAAHELATPLSTIRLIAAELQDQPAILCNPRLSEDAQLLCSESNRCQRILSSLDGKFSEPAAELFSQVDARELEAELRLAIGEKIMDYVSCTWEQEQLGLVPKKALAIVLGSLLKNAVEASTADQKVELVTKQEKHVLQFLIRDSGSGMANEQIKRLGEPFFSTKPVGQGMGLGVFLARLFTERLGGSLDFLSELGCGTKVILSLPRRQA